MKVSQYAKAIVGAGVAGLSALIVAMNDGVVTQSEWLGVAVATLTAAGTVWAVPNAPKEESG